MLVDIARSLPAPRRSIHFRSAIILNPHHRIVVVEQSASFNISEPQAGVSTLARSARTKKHIRLSLATHHRGMKQQCIHLRRSKSIYYHHRVVYSQLWQFAQCQRRTVIVAVTCQPSCHFATRAEHEQRIAIHVSTCNLVALFFLPPFLCPLIGQGSFIAYHDTYQWFRWNHLKGTAVVEQCKDVVLGSQCHHMACHIIISCCCHFS